MLLLLIINFPSITENDKLYIFTSYFLKLFSTHRNCCIHENAPFSVDLPRARAPHRCKNQVRARVRKMRAYIYNIHSTDAARAAPDLLIFPRVRDGRKLLLWSPAGKKEKCAELVVNRSKEELYTRARALLHVDIRFSGSHKYVSSCWDGNGNVFRSYSLSSRIYLRTDRTIVLRIDECVFKKIERATMQIVHWQI